VAKRLELIAIFGGMLALLAPMMIRLAYSWAGPHVGAPLLVFDSHDPNLFLLIGIILVTPVVWIFCPQLFVPNPKLGLKECIIIGFAISGILGFSKALFSDDYLETARQYSQRHGYLACSDEFASRFSEAVMVRDLDACADPGLFWPVQSASS